MIRRIKLWFLIRAKKKQIRMWQENYGEWLMFSQKMGCTPRESVDFYHQRAEDLENELKALRNEATKL